ncbi:hypothetical protein CBP51_16245 [Cellvibrio mixtus]|uniref:Cryptochrome DASH n=1 Tax=Cellvibrio mixtus TaxID=39650 RepID=A0A266Q4E4_9GAMM|nr:DASH family cryptochrome [Cellvibrio mixtus]OZY84720.1 hypothetical protein CBP51_16245 [Cellvibrio mixtus]
MRTAIYWFRYDLRLQDNPGWSHLVANNDRVIGVYVLPERWLHPWRYQQKSLGIYRQYFLVESLQQLRQQLRAQGSDLIVVVGDPARVLAELIEQWDIGAIATGEHPGSDEQQDVKRVRELIDIPLRCDENFTLFDRIELPFALADLPLAFSTFRKQVEARPCTMPLPPAPALRQPLHIVDSPCELDQRVGIMQAQQLVQPMDQRRLPFQGGSAAGLAQLHYFLGEQQLLGNYKNTRNGLDGWDFSSKLSPWLALGCISARQVAHAIKGYEQQYGANESTYWLYFELLWREYFQWLAFRAGKTLFSLRGIQNKNPLLSFYPEAFAAWCAGNTGNAFVDAFMRQLAATGWMSNRGRQIVASYLINQLGVDWRYGAAWFEQQLIDYDCAANWGNWQYLAGVGTDPRGRREFNIQKQRDTYDPEGAFIRRWCEPERK